MLEEVNIPPVKTLNQTISKNTKTGVLLIHGLTGAPTEVKPTARYLKQLGYRVEVPLLAGHGAGHEELLATKWQDWLESVRKPLKTLTTECEEVVIVGLSVGGLLGVLLSCENPNVRGLVLLSFALGIPGPNTPKSRLLLPLIYRFPFLRKHLFWTELPPYGLKDKRLQQNITRIVQASKKRETTKYGLFRTYVDTLYQHELLEQEVMNKAKSITCPTLIIHSLEDTMLSTENATTIYGLLGSKEKSIKFITGCDHVMTVDLRKDDVASWVGSFVSKYTDSEEKGQVVEKNILTCEVHSHINPLPVSEWKRLFHNSPDPVELINLVQRSGIDGFAFHSILIKEGTNPILVLPLFETNYNISKMVDENARKAFDFITGWSSKLFCPKVLGVGFVEGEWGQIGFDQNTDIKTLDQAWDLALQGLETLALGIGANITTFVNFSSNSGKVIPLKKLKNYTDIKSLSFAQLHIKHQNIEDYINSLSSSMRKDLRRKMRQAADLKIIRTKNIKPYLETIYKFYQQLVEKSKLTFGIHRPSYFEHICDLVPGAEYTLYFLEEKLIGFKLNIVEQGCLVDKYFGMDLQQGRQNNLYFISWLENVKYCIENKIPMMHAGQSEEELKERLGAKLIPTTILFKHKNPFIHWLLGNFRNQLSYESKIELPNVELGTFWKDFDLK